MGAMNGDFGELLRHWRRHRGLKQLELALEANVSGRHLSFLETGRARPSRHMVINLSRALGLPAQERNQLLGAAGFAPLHVPYDPDTPHGAEITDALSLILRQSEPFPVCVYDSDRRMVMCNGALYRGLCAFLGESYVHPVFAREAENTCLLRLLLAPDILRPMTVNWDEMALHMVNRLARELNQPTISEHHRARAALLLELPGLPDPNEGTRTHDGSDLLPVLHFKHGRCEMRMFQAVTTLAAPEGVPFNDLFVETFYPCDDATFRNMQAVAQRPLTLGAPRYVIESGAGKTPFTEVA
jgi:transcriptional regulator with XRE-family HTH domain